MTTEWLDDMGKSGYSIEVTLIQNRASSYSVSTVKYLNEVIDRPENCSVFDCINNHKWKRIREQREEKINEVLNATK